SPICRSPAPVAGAIWSRGSDVVRAFAMKCCRSDRGWLLFRLGVLLLLAGAGAWPLSGQIVRDREPPGPCTRRTGFVITEIMYNPRPVPGLATNLTLEFLEVYNSKPWDEDLGGYFIDGVVHYVFPSNTVVRAGAYVVVARVPELVRTNYGITNVLGPWDGA